MMLLVHCPSLLTIGKYRLHCIHLAEGMSKHPEFPDDASQHLILNVYFL